MKHLLLLLFISFSAFAQNPDSTGLVLTPIPSYNPSTQYTDDAVERSLHHMKNYKSPLNDTPQAEMTFQEKMNTLHDDKFNFQEYNIKPSDVYDELPSGKLIPIEQAIPDKVSKAEDSNIAGIMFGLFCVIGTVTILFILKKTKRL